MSSWLAIERYALGECDEAEVRAIEEALASDPDARAMLAAIRTDARAIPPLPRSARHPPRSWAWGLLGLAAAAVAALVLTRPDDRGPGTKGGDVALELVRERGGVQTVAPDEVAVGDRLGLRLTCPPGRTDVDVVVVQGDEVGFPIPAGPIACGNQVALPGAFSVDSPGQLLVCVAVGNLPSREALAADPWSADRCVETVVR